MKNFREGRNHCWPVAGLVLIATWPALAQKFEITPLVGATFGGTIKVQQEGQDDVFRAHLKDSISYGIAGGFRFSGGDYSDYCEDCSVIEFRWMRQDSRLGLEKLPLTINPLGAPIGSVGVTLDHYLGDFTHEWAFKTSHATVRPYLTASLGAARMATEAGAKTRFAFGFGTGVKIFSEKRWGLRLNVEYLPTVMHADVQTLDCRVACVVSLTGGVMNQFAVSIGPVIRF